jgi:hypothetical protein
MPIQEMIRTHPQFRGEVNNALIRCIEACYSCAQACNSCADACLGEPMVQQLTQCIRLNLDCADVCATTGRLATRRTGSNEQLTSRMIETCAEACRMCAVECGRHAEHHEHCKLCAEACRTCEQACRDAKGSFH